MRNFCTCFDSRSIIFSVTFCEIAVEFKLRTVLQSLLHCVGNIVSQMSFHRETSGGIAKCWIPSQVTSTLLFGVLHLACLILKFLFSGFILEIIGLWDSVGADFKV